MPYLYTHYLFFYEQGKIITKKGADISRASSFSSLKTPTWQPPTEATEVETAQPSPERQSLLNTMKNTSVDLKSLSLTPSITRSPIAVQASLQPRAQGEVNRRSQGYKGKGEDGSGQHGAAPANVTDHTNKAFWYGVADGAEGLGMTNAARHMRHYLGNTGAKLIIDVGMVERDVPSFRKQVAEQIQVAKNDANLRIADNYKNSPMKFTLTGIKPRDGGYALEEESKDWYFAMGGFQYWYSADVTVEPSPKPRNSKDKKLPPPKVKMNFRMHIFDRYNWDQGKQVEIAGIVVEDKILGRLHQVGIAKEYDIEGTGSYRYIEWIYTPPNASSERSSGGAAPRGLGGRADTTRNRGIVPNVPNIPHPILPPLF